MAGQLNDSPHTRREAAGHHIDAHMLVALERMPCSQEEDGGKQVPLYFDEGVGPGAGLACESREHRNKDSDQYQPGNRASQCFVEAVDATRQFQQNFHDVRHASGQTSGMITACRGD